MSQDKGEEVEEGEKKIDEKVLAYFMEIHLEFVFLPFHGCWNAGYALDI